MSILIEPLELVQFVADFRDRKSAAFDLEKNSTGRSTRMVPLWGKNTRIYSNANLSIYSAQTCNARCHFCVEELRPASRGTALVRQKVVERDDEKYFAALEATLSALAPLSPSASVTGGEPSKDPRLPRILQMLSRHEMRKRTMTTNGSGLLDEREGRRIIDWVLDTGVRHLNVSRAHPDEKANARLMRLREGLSSDELRAVVSLAKGGGTRVRLSCVLLNEAIHSLSGIVQYLNFADSVGVDNVIFRQLMKTDQATHEPNEVVLYSDDQRVPLKPLLDEMSSDGRFAFQRQIVGYYYYVEVWRYKHIDVVFEEADLAQLEIVKRQQPDVIHELIFHPNGKLASTWQPWDGILGPSLEHSSPEMD
jgi:GTP 3',8-cyclase